MSGPPKPFSEVLPLVLGEEDRGSSFLVGVTNLAQRRTPGSAPPPPLAAEPDAFSVS